MILIIELCFKIPQYYVIVAFENEKELVVFDLMTNESMSETVELRETVRKLEGSNQKYFIMSLYENSSDQTDLAVLLNDGSIEFFTIKPDKTERKLCFEKLKGIPSSGRDLVSFEFGFYVFGSSKYNFYLASYNDGTLIYGQNIEWHCVKKIKLAQKLGRKEYKLVLVDSQINRDLFIDKNSGNLVLILKGLAYDDYNEFRTCHVAEIEGKFDKGVLVAENIVVGISFDTIYSYLVALNDDLVPVSECLFKSTFELNLVLIDTIEAHFDEITFAFRKCIHIPCIFTVNK